LVINSSYFDFQEISNSEIITTLNTNPELLYSVKQNNNSIYAVSNDINLNIISNSNGLYIIPNPTVSRDTVFYALKANDEQKQQIKTLIEKYKNAAAYEFFDTEQRKNLAGRTVRTIDGKEYNMEQNTIKELQDYQLQELPAKENFENAAPDELPDDRKSVNITYKWRNVPFYFPDGSKRDKLYIDWENETLKIKQRLGEILQKINQLETDESKLSSKIFNFLSRKKQKFNGYKTEIDTLKNVEFSGLKPEELKTKIARINEIHRDVNTSVAGINE